MRGIIVAMNITRTKLIAASVAGAAAVTLGVAAIATAGGEDAGERETPIAAAEYQRAADAALAAVPGKVTDTEVGDEEGYYEVEVTRADGSEVDVHLDQSFTLLGSEAETADEAGDDD